jgi:NADPH:quinone reductase-like Zn-dependent oxidoreductase
VLGARGGVATTAVSLAAAVGAHVFVTSSSEAKIDAARELGAAGCVLYTDDAWPEAVGWWCSGPRATTGSSSRFGHKPRRSAACGLAAPIARCTP